MIRQFRVLLLFFVTNGLWRRLPPAYAAPGNCSNYIEYLSNDAFNFIGRITLSNFSRTPGTLLTVKLSQSEPLSSSSRGSLSPWSETTPYDIQIGTLNFSFTTDDDTSMDKYVSYRIDFPDPSELPKLININVNGTDICFDNADPEENTTLSLKHTLTPISYFIYNSTLKFTKPSQLKELLGLDDNTDEAKDSEISETIDWVAKLELSSSDVGNIQINQDQSAKNPSLTEQIQQQQQQYEQTTKRLNISQLIEVTNILTNRDQPVKANTVQNINTTCGCDFVPLIGNSTEVKRGQFPWLVAINKKATGSLRFLCGGSLISTRTVVTAAHCLKFPNTVLAHQIVIYLGRYNLDNYSEKFERREIETLLIHPDYDLISFPDADIALIQLVLAVSFSPFIQPICLWSDTSLIVGENGVIAGWSADKSGRSNLPKIVNSSIVGENICRKSQGLSQGLTMSRTICTGNRDGKGPCIGDSGGGLMLKRNGHWHLRGIVSAGLKSEHECDMREYVIYCDLAKHIQWVQDNMLE